MTKLYIFGEGSNHYVGACDFSMEEIEDKMGCHEPVRFKDVRQVVTFNIPGQRGIQRITRLVTVDLALGPVTVMTVHPTSIQPVDEPMMEGYRLLLKEAEDDELQGRAKRSGLATV